MKFADEPGAELRELFFETSQELLQALNKETLKLEKHPGDEEIVRVIRRTVHTLKGDSAACGLRELSELAHQLEDALSLESAAAHAGLAEIAFGAADAFAEMIAAYQGGGKIPATQSLRRKIQELTATPGAKKSRRKKVGTIAAPRAGTHWSEYEKLAVKRAQAGGLNVYHVVAKIDPHCTMPIAGRQIIHNAVASIGQVLAARPETNSPAASKQVEFVVATRQPEDQIAAKCRIPTIASEISVTLMPGVVAASAEKSLPGTQPLEDNTVQTSADGMAAENQASAPGSSFAPTQTENILRVEAGRIDSVLNLVGELIIGKSMLQQVLSELSKRYPKEQLRGRFADAIAFQARVLNDLQRSVMKIRMVPVEQLFRRFPRMVRDVALQCGRDVELVVSGQDTDLDKGILDAIAEPLTHMVRNAVSHGIEPPEERQRLGKPAEGKVRLNAYHQGNQVIVEISDDGRGMDVAKIRTKAIELGLLEAEEAARLSETEILEIIFRPGFSTAEQVTEVSGRGVGMDVVQSVLHRLKGTVGVQTQLGQGTTFRLKLPLTLAIIQALLFWVEQRLYAIPLNAVVEIARTTESQVHQVDNYEVLQLRNQVLPVLRVGQPATDARDGKPQKLFVLVTLVGEKKFGLIVDALEGEGELVIKALDDRTFETDLVSGASILGDGRVVLILNLPAVVEHVASSRPTQAGATSSGLLLSHTDRTRLALSTVGGHA
jgi:two-component system, chemotaxis family, sensor kinase CheA